MSSNSKDSTYESVRPSYYFVPTHLCSTFSHSSKTSKFKDPSK